MSKGEGRVSGARFQDKPTEKAMKKAFLGFTLSALLFALCPFADAQQPTELGQRF